MAYPPTFLLAVLPFSQLPFGVALTLYSVLGLIAYGSALVYLCRRLDRKYLPVLAAFPGVSIAIGLGQNFLFTVAAAGAALVMIEFDAALAGVCIAFLAIKPQFGVLFPLALICSRQWNVFAVAALCTLTFAGATVVAFGPNAWYAFKTFLPQFSELAVNQGGSMMWPGMPTMFAPGRNAGLSVNAAYLLHGVAAVPAAVAMAFLWAQRARFELRAAALIIATMLMQPYVMFYDLVWLILPIVLLLRDARAAALGSMERLILAAAWLAPAQALLSAYLHHYLNVLPAVLLSLLVIVVRRHLAATVAAPAISS
ncbi:glycosyltransferase family 87 protein [Cupriavidus pinatubonensis]|uniref:glycosyltransferase family 87 protein n=1 Tax=Cupriavidus pinatubonensis TaxID=248026 RepID=UPI001FD53BEA|nr:glycosyltransferase family 87 protein [Cupriavidus pinatubonensis]